MTKKLEIKKNDQYKEMSFKREIETERSIKEKGKNVCNKCDKSGTMWTPWGGWFLLFLLS